MKHFCTFDYAKKQVQIYQNYINLIEQYQPETLIQHTIHIYAHLGNAKRTAAKLNELQFQIDGRPITPKDITSIISSKPSPDDLLHKEVKRLYQKRLISLKR